MNGTQYDPGPTAGEASLRDPAEALPEELVCEVFRKLDIVGRLAVSRVCTLWRLIALSDRRLWAQWRVNEVSYFRRGDKMAAALTEMLARSSPLPFRLECDKDVPGSISELVISNAWRLEVLLLRHLRTDDALERLLAQDVPVLRKFSFYPKMHPQEMRMSLSARWATAPRLESLLLQCPCLWPPGCTMPTLRSFAGYMPDTPYAPLSALFPNATELTLYKFTDELLPRLEPLPRSLTALNLFTADGGIDCAALLRGWKTTALRELRIDWSSSTACALEVFLLFARVVSGPWALHLDVMVARLHARPSTPQTHRYGVSFTKDVWHERVAEILPLCTHLCELTLPPFYLPPLCAAHAVLPALTAVTVKSSRSSDGRWPSDGRWLVLQDQPRVHAPALRNVVVFVSADREFDARRAEMVGLIVRAFRSPRLASVVIHVLSRQPFPGEDVSRLSDLAERVEVRGPEENVLHAYTSAAEGTASSAA